MAKVCDICGKADLRAHVSHPTTKPGEPGIPTFTGSSVETGGQSTSRSAPAVLRSGSVTKHGNPVPFHTHPFHPVTPFLSRSFITFFEVAEIADLHLKRADGSHLL